MTTRRSANAVARCALVLACALALPPAGEAHAQTATQQKKQVTKQTVAALQKRMEDARDALRAVADAPAPAKLNPAQRKLHDAQMKEIQAVAEVCHEASVELAAGLAEPTTNLRILTENAERKSQAVQKTTSVIANALTNISNMKHESLKGIATNLRG
jgi:hypothetical protein